MGKILGNFLNLVIGAIVVWLIVWFFFYNPEPTPEPQPEDDALVTMYGEGATAVIDEDFTATETVVAKENAVINDEVVGSLYTISKEGEYFGGAIGTITFKIALDEDLIMVGYIEVLYEHTGGFKPYVTGFLDDLVGTNLNDFNDLDGSTGATATTTLLITLLEDLKNAVNN